jgi:hypothetical protein
MILSHKTIYIDIDEEITSIIDRMRKSEAREVIIVAPKRALLLQSLVNLKLLKKESDRKRKKIMIVTQDKIGKKLIEKAGIMVQGKMDDSMMNEDEAIEEVPGRKGGKAKMDGDIVFEEDKEEFFGSDSYFEKVPEKNPVPVGSPLEEAELKNNNIDKVKFMEPKDKKIAETGAEKEKKEAPKKGKSGRKSEKSVRMSDIVAGPKPKPRGGAQNSAEPEKKARQKVGVENNLIKTSQFYEKSSQSPHLEKQAEKFFSSPDLGIDKISRRKAGKLKETKIRSKVGKYFTFFVIIFVILAGLAWGYYNIPKADVTIQLKGQEEGVSASIEANVSTKGIEENKIPAILEQMIKEKSSDFEATGSKSGGGKAAGKVVIYNEFSADNQPLVATTRLETSDGKIFRITKAVVVPGITKVGTETKPGAIEVDVVADKAGESYNIDPSDFKIPGFKDGPKYNKFYAKSTKAMSGGSAGETALVSAEDIERAKEKLVAEAKNEIIDELKKSLPSERKIFEDSVAVDIASSDSSVKAGTETEKFTYSVQVKAKTLSFSEEDVKEIIKAQLKKDKGQSGQITFSKSISYILSEENMEGGYVKFEAKADVGIASDVDLENFKRGILGKSAEEVTALVKNYPVISKAEVIFWPVFIKRVPINEKQVKIEIK